MKTLRIEVEIPEDLRRDVEQGVYYCSSSIVASRVDRERGSSIEIDVLDEADPASLEQTVRSWIEQTIRSSLRYEATTVREWGGHDGFVATTEEVLGSPEIHGLGEGLVAYGPKLTRALRAIHGLCESLSEGVGADPFTLPAVATLEHMHRCDYLRQFPQLLSFVTHFREDFGAIDAYSLQCRNAQVADACVPSTDETRPVKRELDESRSLIELGVIDSFTFVEVLTALQEELGVEIDFMELDPDDFDSVKGLVRVAAAAVERS